MCSRELQLQVIGLLNAFNPTDLNKDRVESSMSHISTIFSTHSTLTCNYKTPDVSEVAETARRRPRSSTPPVATRVSVTSVFTLVLTKLTVPDITRRSPGHIDAFFYFYFFCMHEYNIFMHTKKINITYYVLMT